MPASLAHRPLLAWNAVHARDLPWRRIGVSAWEVLVSEVMLQQTPVARVLPAYDAWITRWPVPSALAAEAAGEAVRMWGRLGYPRRALRLHQAAQVIEAHHDGTVPSTYDELKALPGIGDYTAAAVCAFAFRQRAVVLDTNVRRTLNRVFGGLERASPHITRAERLRAAAVLPDDPDTAATWSVAVMELGALVCTARAPRCGQCPLADQCAWRAQGYPAYDGPPPTTQTYAGTDRQCRGRIMALLRENESPVCVERLDAVWQDPAQRERALASLIDDGLVVHGGEGMLTLP